LAFDPDAYLAATSSSGFDPDAYLGIEQKSLPRRAADLAGNVGAGAMETLYAPFQLAGEAIRGASEGEPLKVATANDPTGFRLPSIVQHLASKYKTEKPPADPFQKAYQGLEGIAALPFGLQNASDIVTGQPDTAAQLGGLGMSLAMGKAGDPYEALSVMKKNILAPKVAASRAADIGTAERYGMGPLLTRADKSGSKTDAYLESALGNSLTGSGPIQANNAQKLALLQQASESAAKKFGTEMPPSVAGQEARSAMQNEMGQASQTARDLYKEIPDVPIPPTNLEKALQETDFQNVDKGALRTINEIRSRIGKTAQATEETTPNVIGTPEMVNSLESQYRVKPVSPEAAPPPTFQKLNEIRNMLSKEIQADTHFNPITGNQVGEKAQALIPIKKALDADYKAYIQANQDTPYGQLESGKFESAFNRANSFYGNLKDLKGNKLVQKLANRDTAASDIPSIVFKSGNIEDINTAKAVLGQEGYDAAKKQWFTELLNSKNIGRELNKHSGEFLQGALRPQELQALRDIDALRRVSNAAETVAGNTSRTAGHMATYGTGLGLLHAAAKMVHSPAAAAVEAAGILGLPFAAVRAYLGSAKGFNIPAGVSGDVGKLAGAIGATEGIAGFGIGDKNKETLSKVLERIRSKKGS
jgi:hypothetical protein